MRVVLLSLALSGCTLAQTGAPAADLAGDGGGQVGDMAGGSGGDLATPVAGTPTLVRVLLADGAAPSLRGEGPLAWDRGVAMDKVAPGVWEKTVVLTGAVDLKPLRDDKDWSLGANYRARPGETLTICPRFQVAKGRATRRWPDANGGPLGQRGVWVYTPPGMSVNPGCRYPVLYMHDGQNLFDPRAAFGGVTWQVAETLDAGANAADPAAALPEVIVVGPENAGAGRIDEYTPVPDAMYGGGGGDAYLRLLTDTLKPYIDGALPTRADATVLVGSSLGGLITAYAGLSRPQVFGRLGVMSPSTWWANGWLIGKAKTAPIPPGGLLYIDSGDSGPSNDDVDETRALAAAYREAGYRDGTNLLYVVQAGAQHNERYWAERLPAALRFLLRGF